MNKQANLIKVAVTGPNGPCEIHKAGCRDLDQTRKYRSQAPWTVEVPDRVQLAIEIYGDVATDEHQEGTDAWREACIEFFEGEYRVMPCIAKELIMEATK